jgi:hypothetical protein
MKILWFHLMPYTRLPEDFAQRHASVWVDIDPALFDARFAHELYNEFMDELEYAAELGFDGVCVNEHHQNGYGLMPSPNLIAAGPRARTSDAALVVMGNSLALYNPPVRVAEEMAMLDCISGGRLVAGFPVGTPMDTCFAYGQNPSQLRERYFEAHDLILRAWQADAPFTWNGRYHQLRYVNVWPRPVQKPHPPGVDPRRGSIETWQWCAERDYVYSYLSYFGYKLGRATMKGYWRSSRGSASKPIRIAPDSSSSSASRSRARKRSSCTASRLSTSMGAACTWIRASRRPPATRARRHCVRACSRRSRARPRSRARAARAAADRAWRTSSSRAS